MVRSSTLYNIIFIAKKYTREIDNYQKIFVQHFDIDSFLYHPPQIVEGRGSKFSEVDSMEEIMYQGEV